MTRTTRWQRFSADEALILPDDLPQVPLTPHVGAMSEDAPARPVRTSTVTIRVGGVELSATAESREAALRELLRAAEEADAYTLAKADEGEVP